MDDALTPVTAWLAFSLAFDNSARYCQFIRQSQPDVNKLGQLLHRYVTGADKDLEQALTGKLDAADLRSLKSNVIAEKIDRALQWCDCQPNHHLIGLDHPNYPSLLQQTDDAPILLYAKGTIETLDAPKIAIVGSRKASTAAIRHTRTTASRLAQRGVAIVSGLALGIDAAAHQGALDVHGMTIAVAATEIDTVYPKRHRALAKQIIDQNGLIVTEYPLGAATLRWYFPRRNRIISGISCGVVVAEAALPSGTLTTATHAMNQGREVMAVPGSVQNFQAAGCHSLIKQGAALVENDSDVVDALGPELHRELDKFKPLRQPSLKATKSTELANTGSSEAIDGGFSDIEIRILDYLSTEPATIDSLMTHLQLGFSELSTVLGLLEIRGKIAASASGRYVRC